MNRSVRGRIVSALSVPMDWILRYFDLNIYFRLLCLVTFDDHATCFVIFCKLYYMPWKHGASVNTEVAR